MKTKWLKFRKVFPSQIPEFNSENEFKFKNLTNQFSSST